MKTFAAALAVTSLVSLAAACETVGTDADPTHTGTEFVATLDGQAEVPPGDPNGSGEFAVWVDPAMGRVCYTLGTAGISTPTMAHIHKGDAHSSGPVVVPLTTPVHNLSDTCTPVSADVANQIIADPDDYYVNVHTADYPQGAIRAQLMRPKK